MKNGVIEQVGAPIEIYREPASPFVVDFVGKAKVVKGRITAPGKLQLGERTLDCANRCVRMSEKPK